MLSFPTQMCMHLASQMDLFDANNPRVLTSNTALKLFQQLAVGGTMDEAMRVFDTVVANDLKLDTIPKEYAEHGCSLQLPGEEVEKLKNSEEIKKASRLVLHEGDRGILKLIYELTKKELLGMAVETIIQTMSEATSPKKEKLAGAAIIDSMFGEGEGHATSTLTDKLVINLVAGGDSK